MEVAGIYREFHKSLLGFIKNRIKSKEDAEDILQNVFVKISSNVDKLSEEEKLTNWMFTITRNAIIDYYRKNATKKKNGMQEDISEIDVMDITEPDPMKGLDSCVSPMIALLPEEYRDIVIDAELKGIRQKDLAEKYGVPYPSMRSKVQRGRERLKQLFYNCCHIQTDTRGNVLEAHGKSDCGCQSCSPSTDSTESN